MNMFTVKKSVMTHKQDISYKCQCIADVNANYMLVFVSDMIKHIYFISCDICLNIIIPFYSTITYSIIFQKKMYFDN